MAYYKRFTKLKQKYTLTLRRTSYKNVSKSPNQTFGNIIQLQEFDHNCTNVT